jgi:hypothetical protein
MEIVLGEFLILFFLVLTAAILKLHVLNHRTGIGVKPRC